MEEFEVAFDFSLHVNTPILKYFAIQIGEEYELSTPEEESKGVDGYIGSYSASVKSRTEFPKDWLK